MKKLLTFLLLVGCFSPVWAEEAPKISVRGYNKQFTPGSFMTLFFDVEKSIDQSYIAELKLPKGWYVITSKTTDKSKGQSYMYTISIDQNTPAKPHPITFYLLGESEPVAELTIPIGVEEIRQIDITPLEIPEYFREGTTVRTAFLVQNMGNILEKFKVTTSQGVVESGDTLSIPAYGSATVYVKQTIPMTETPTWAQSVDLKLEPMVRGGNPSYRVVSVPVYSSKTKKTDPYLRFPVEAGMTYLFFDIQGKPFHAYQYIASGEGSTDHAGHHVVGFQVRGPNNLNFPALGSYDEYSLSYRYKEKTKLWVGDYVNRVNNLMEFSRFGRGFRFEQSFQKGDISIFYQNARFFPGQKGSFGASMHLKPNERVRIGVDLVTKELVMPNGLMWTTLFGVSGQYTGKHTQIDTEVSMSQSGNSVDLGGYNRILYQKGRWNINSEAIYAGKNYFGFYTNSRYLVNSVSYQLSSKFSLGGSSNFTRLNPSLDLSVFNTAPFNKIYTAFLNWQPSIHQIIFLNYTFLEREDRIKPASFHFKENFANLNYSLNTTGWQITAQARGGQAVNLLSTDDLLPKDSYSGLLQPFKKITKWMWLGGYAEYQYTSKFSAQNVQEGLFFYGGTLRGELDKRLSYQIMFRNNYTPDAFVERRSFSDISINYQTGVHRFSLNAGRAFIGNGVDNLQGTRYFSFRYTFSVNAPIRRNRNVGHVIGKLSTPNQVARKDGVMVKLGPYRTVTDVYGNFYFSNIPPEQYLLTFDRSSALAGFKTENKGSSIPVKVQPQQTEEVEIKMIRTGGVVGKLTLDVDPSQPLKPTPPFLIKIFNDEESYLTKVEANTAYSFKELKPGTWTVQLLLPEYGERFNVAEAERTLDVVAGQDVTFNFSLSRATRQILFNGKDFKVTARP